MQSGNYSRWLNARTAIWALCLALGTLVLSEAGAGEEPQQNPAQYLPDSTILCVQLGPWKDWSQNWDKTSLAQIFQEPEVKAFLAGPMGRLRKLLDSTPEGQPAPTPAPQGPSTIGTIFNTLGDIAPGPVVLALRYSPEDAQAKRLPAAFISGTKDASQVAMALQVLLNWFSSKIPVKQEAYQTANLLIFKTESYTFTLAFHNKFLILTTDTDFCKQVVDGMAGMLPKKLADNEAYKTCGLSGSEPLGAFLDVAALHKAWGAEEGGGGGKLKESLAQAGLEDLSAIAWSLQIEGPAFKSRTALLTSGKRKGLLAALESEPVSTDTVFRLPGSSFAVGARVTEQNILPLLRSFFKGTVGQEGAARLDAAIQKREAETKRDLKKDLAEAFGNEVFLTSYSRKEAPTGALTGVVGTLSVKDRKKAEELMVDLMKRTVLERVPPENPDEVLQQVDFEGEKIRYLRPAQNYVGLSPIFALLDTRLVVTLDMLTLKNALQILGKKDSTPFREELARAGGPGSLFIYADWGQIYESAFAVSATTLKFLASANLLRQAGVDVNLLPTPEAITKHLFPSIAIVQATDKGLVLTSRSPLPSAEVLAPPVAACAAIVATFTGSAEPKAEGKPAEPEKRAPEKAPEEKPVKKKK